MSKEGDDAVPIMPCTCQQQLKQECNENESSGGELRGESKREKNGEEGQMYLGGVVLSILLPSYNLLLFPSVPSHILSISFFRGSLFIKRAYWGGTSYPGFSG